MTKTFVQLYVENLLKVLKLWKTVSLTNRAPVSINKSQKQENAFGKSAENPKFASQTLNFRHLKDKIKQKRRRTSTTLKTE